ncbi:lipopolysaccharide biosynthesis protein [Bacterioplanoides sp.]|uniref:lipopolysaccharide biosynthesis protein n=1 Tax=Bacterioplanoides sp. TaxID=2066072 RepID=UPI003B005279
MINKIRLDKTYLKNLSFQGAGNVIAQVINIVSLPLVTRLYAPDDLGMLKVFIEALAFLTILMSLRVEHLIMLPKKERDAELLFRFVLSCGALSSLLVTSFIVILVVFDYVEDGYILWLLLLPVTSYILVLSQSAQYISQRADDFKVSGISEVVNKFSNSLYTIIYGIFNAGGIGLAIGILVGFTFKGVIFSKKIIHLLNIHFVRNIAVGIKIIRSRDYKKLIFSLVSSHSLLAVTSISPLWYISYNWDGEKLGFFSLVLSTLVLPTALIGQAVGQVYYQRASRLHANGECFKDLFLNNIKLLVLLGVSGYSIVFFYGEILYTFVFGDKWLYSGQIAEFYVFAALIGFVSIPFEKTSLIVNAWWYSPIWYVLRVVTTLLVILISELLRVSFTEFLHLLTFQIALMHLVDVLASYYFSALKARG